MHLKRSLIGLLAAAAIGAAACGSNNDSTTPADVSTPATTPSGSSVAVKVADSKLGKILIGTDGKSLYAFTNDAWGFYFNNAGAVELTVQSGSGTSGAPLRE